MNKKLLVLGAGQEHCIAITAAKRLGYRVVACDANPEAPGLTVADVAIVADIRNISELIKIGQRYSVDGVFCHAVEIPDVVATVADKLGLPGLQPQIARLCTNKSDRILALQNSGIPVADFRFVASRKDLVTIGPSFGFPFILKPVDNAGSRGVQLVRNEQELLSAYDEAMQYSRNSAVLIERKLSGPQISTESVVYKGKVHTFAFADRNYAKGESFAPYFIENGINFPSLLPQRLQVEVIELVEKTINVLGINFGAAKGDIIIHEGVPHIIEMASRTSGGWFGAGSIPAATGVDPLKPLLQMSVGDLPDMASLSPTRMLGCAQRYWIPEKDAIFHSVSGLENVPQMPGVEIFNSFFPAAESRICKAQHHAQRYAQVICIGQTREEAIYRAEAAIKSIVVAQTFI